MSVIYFFIYFISHIIYYTFIITDLCSGNMPNQAWTLTQACQARQRNQWARLDQIYPTAWEFRIKNTWSLPNKQHHNW